MIVNEGIRSSLVRFIDKYELDCFERLRKKRKKSRN